METLTEEFIPQRSSSRVIVKPFSFEAVEHLKHTLSLLQHDNVTGRKYSIHLDGEMIIEPTTDIERFDEYMSFMDEYCGFLEVRSYFGNSPNFRAHRFIIKNASFFQGQQVNGLGEVEINHKIDSAVALERHLNKVDFLEQQIGQLREQKQSEIEQLLKENLRLKRKLKKLKKLAKQQTQESGGGIGDLLTKGVELFGMYQASKAGIPATPSNSETPLGEATGAGVTIEPQEPTQNKAGSSSLDQYIEELKKDYPEDQIVGALKLTELINYYPDLKCDVEALILAKIKQKD